MKAIGRSSTVRKFLSGALLLGILLSFLSGGGLPLVRAQEAATPTPEGTDEGTPEPKKVKEEAEPIPSQVILKFKDKTKENEKDAVVKAHGGKVVQRIDALNIMVVTLPNGKGPGNVHSPFVESIEQDYYIDSLDEVIPNDPRYPEQWALPAIGAPGAWAELPADAPKVTVAVVDSGICASHPDLAGRILDGWDFLEDDADPQDDYGHGCSVAGIIAANMNDGIGIAGVAPNAQIMPLRVLNASGVGSYSDVAAAIVYAADNGAQVINLSLGGSNPSAALESAVNYASDKGLIIVAAAGNNGTEGALYPAAYSDVIAVGSVDPDLQYSSFSNYGSQIDIWAPGRDVLTVKKDGSYGLVSGTSFAAPYVVGAIALNNSISLTNILWIGANSDVNPTETQIFTTTPEMPNTEITVEFNRIIEVPEHLKSPTLRMLSENIQLLPNNHRQYTVSAFRAIDKWAKLVLVPTFIVNAYWEVEYDYQDIIFAIAHYDDSGKWIVYFENSDAFDEIKHLVPQNFIDYSSPITGFADDTKSIFLFPWERDTSWRKTRDPGWHDGTALDFAPTTGANHDVLASASGNLDIICDDGDQIQVAIANTNGNLQYWHLDGDSIDRYLDDQFVRRGRKIGSLYTGTAGARIVDGVSYQYWTTCGRGTGPHLHFVSPTSLTIEGQLITNIANSPRNTSYASTNTKLDSTAVTVCSDANFQGRCERFTFTDENLMDGNYIGDNSISSYFVPANWGATLWEHPWSMSRGGCLPFNPIQYDTGVADFSIAFVWQDCGYGGSVGQRLNELVSAIEITWNPNVIACNLELNAQCVTNPPPTNPPPTTPPPPTPPPGTIDGLRLISMSSHTVQRGQTFQATIVYEVVSGQLLQSRGDLLFGFDPNYYGWPHQAVTRTYNPGERITFNFNLTAPQQTGTFQSKWQFMIGGVFKGPQAIVQFTVQDPPPPPAPTCPQSGGVILYWNNNYDCGNGDGDKGYRQRTSTGWQDVNDGSFNDKASSVIVPSGWSVMLYEHAGRQGAKVCYNTNISDFGPRGNFPGTSIPINDHVSSMEVFSDTVCGVTPPPSANFDAWPLSGNRPFTTALHIVSMTGITNCSWDYGDGQTSNTCSQLHNHTYNSSGSYTVRLTVSGPGGSDSMTRTGYINVSEPPPAPCPTINNWMGEYWTNPSLSGSRALCRDDAELNLDWGNGSPDPVIPADNFSARWTRTLYFSEGTYRFNMRHDDGARLYIDNVLKKDVWGTCCVIDTVDVPLTAGNHTIKMEMYENGGAAHAQLWWVTLGPGSFNKSAPSDTAAVESTTANLSWTSSASATSYEYCVDTVNNNSCDGNWVSNGTSLSKSLTNLTKGQTYYWHVRARNSSGITYSNNNSWWSFKIATVKLTSVFTTNEDGTATSLEASTAVNDDIEANAIKTNFNHGDAIKLYMTIENNFATEQLVTREYIVTNPAGDVVPELTYTGNSPTGTGFWDWSLTRTIPDYLARGEYTFTARVTHNGTTTVMSSTFTISGPPAVEVFDTFVTDGNGLAASSLEVAPQSSVNEVGANAIATNFNAGDPIQLYIHTYNDVAADEPAYFDWSVYDPWGRYVEELSWSGELNSYYGWSWWWLSATIPSHAITGDYTFEGSITYGGRTTYSDATFHVTGNVPPPINDGFASPTLISSIPFNKLIDTWTATTATTDPTPSCGIGQNSNSVWYKYIPSSNGILHVDTFGSDYDTLVTVWTGSLGSLVERGCNDDNFGELQSWLEIPVVAGTSYYIEVMDWNMPGGGDLQLYIDFAQSLSNDDFNSPIIINTNPINPTLDTRGATQSQDDPALISCNRLPGMASVWYRYTPSASGNLQLDTKGSNYDTLLGVWTGTRGNLTSVGCNDDIGYVNDIWDQDSVLTAPVTKGTTYYIEVSTYNGVIDINGASAAEIGKLNRFQSELSVAELKDLKDKLENGEGGLSGLQENDLSAQFWGGQMKLNVALDPTPLTEGKYDDTPGAGSYTGSWTASTGSGWYDNTLHYSATIGNSFTFPLNSNRFALIYRGYTNRGKVDVYVDDIKIATVDEYSGSSVWQKEWVSPNLGAGPHIVRLVHASGAVVEIDAIRVLNGTPPSAITNLAAVTGSTNGSVNLSWSAPGDDNVANTVASYVVRYSASGPINSESAWNSATPVTTGLPSPLPFGNPQTMTVSGLVPGTSYHFAVRGIDSAENMGGLSNSVSAAAKSPTPEGVGVYDDGHTSWTYTGAWTALTGATGPADGTLHRSQTVGDAASFTFSGTQFVLRYTQNTNRGNLGVYVDGNLVTTLNENGSLQWQKTYTSPLFASGTHTVEFRNVGGNTYIDVDSIQILNTTPSLPDLVVTNVTLSPAAPVAGQTFSVNITVQNQGGDLYETTPTPDRIYRDVYVDSTPSACNAGSAYRHTDNTVIPGGQSATQSVTMTGGLAAGTHQLRVYVDVNCSVDETNESNNAFALIEITVNPIPVSGVGVYDDSHANWTYTGAWTALTGVTGPTDGTLHRSQTVGDSAIFTFSGTQIKLKYTQNTNRGNMGVYVDGNLVTTLNENGALQWQKAYTSPLFASGTHTVEFRNAGGSTYVDIDEIEVLNTLPPGAGTYDDSHAGWTYTGGWTAITGATGPTDGTLHRSQTVGDSASFTFSGTQFVLKYTQNANRGNLGVYVDGNLVMTLNENGALQWQKTYTSPLFASGTHTVEFRNAGGSTYTDIDSIQILNTTPSLPDLVVTNVTLSPAAPVAGQTFNVNITVQNQGGDLYQTSPTSDNIYRDVYIDSTPTACDAGSSFRHTDSVLIPGGQSSTQSVTMTGGLAAGTHQLRVYVDVNCSVDETDESNNAFALIEITVDPVPVSGVGIYDDSHANWSYTGAWTALTGVTGPTDGTLHRSQTVGDSAIFTFSGTQFKLKYTQNTNRGNVGVYVDGNLVTTLNENGSLQWQKTYTSPLFASGTHTVEFRNAGGNVYVDIDEIEILNTLPPGAGTYDDSHAGWTYTGGWTAITGAAGPTDGTLHRSQTVGDSASFTFSGTQFILKYTRNTNRGNVGVYVDGNLVTTLNQNGTLEWQTTYISPIYGSGTHIVRIENAGGGTYADIDGIQIP